VLVNEPGRDAEAPRGLLNGNVLVGLLAGSVRRRRGVEALADDGFGFSKPAKDGGKALGWSITGKNKHRGIAVL
jgi:hypothetical protein